MIEQTPFRHVCQLSDVSSSWACCKLYPGVIVVAQEGLGCKWIPANAHHYIEAITRRDRSNRFNYTHTSLSARAISNNCNSGIKYRSASQLIKEQGWIQGGSVRGVHQSYFGRKTIQLAWYFPLHYHLIYVLQPPPLSLGTGSGPVTDSGSRSVTNCKGLS